MKELKDFKLYSVYLFFILNKINPYQPQKKTWEKKLYTSSSLLLENVMYMFKVKFIVVVYFYLWWYHSTTKPVPFFCVAQPTLRSQVVDLVHTVRILYHEASIFLTEKATSHLVSVFYVLLLQLKREVHVHR